MATVHFTTAANQPLFKNTRVTCYDDHTVDELLNDAYDWLEDGDELGLALMLKLQELRDELDELREQMVSSEDDYITHQVSDLTARGY